MRLFFSLGTPRMTADAALTFLMRVLFIVPSLSLTAVAFLSLREQTEAMEISNHTEISKNAYTISTQAIGC
jgi:hypothetical protein